MLDAALPWLLAAAGLAVGAAVNWAIYALAILHRRPVSPWSRWDESRRHPLWFVPVVGWWLQRGLSERFGRGFWLRPMLIELAAGAALPAWFAFIAAGGLVNCRLAVPPPPPDAQAWIWFGQFTVLAALLAAATFIDFDEKTIPDEITLPGTLWALATAWLVVDRGLPELVGLNPGVRVASLNYASPLGTGSWHAGTLGWLATAAIVTVWLAALVPKRVRWSGGLIAGLRLMGASMIRPPRRHPSPLHARPRRPYALTWLALTLEGILLAGVTAAWSAGGPRWESLFSSIVGLGFAGGLVWAVRVIAGASLGREAMGFGDVTLMAMIGAFLGWQPSLLVFALAPFAAIAIAAVQAIVTQRPEIAFGPYLALAAIIVLVGWGPIWNDWASVQIFVLGPLLLVVVAVCLVLMAAMLAGWNQIRRRLFDLDEGPSETRAPARPEKKR